MASINQQTLSVQSDEVQQADVIKHIMYHRPVLLIVRVFLSAISLIYNRIWIYSNMRKIYADVIIENVMYIKRLECNS